MDQTSGVYCAIEFYSVSTLSQSIGSCMSIINDDIYHVMGGTNLTSYHSKKDVYIFEVDKLSGKWKKITALQDTDEPPQSIYSTLVTLGNVSGINMLGLYGGLKGFYNGVEVFYY